MCLRNVKCVWGGYFLVSLATAKLSVAFCEEIKKTFMLTDEEKPC